MRQMLHPLIIKVTNSNVKLRRVYGAWMRNACCCCCCCCNFELMVEIFGWCRYKAAARALFLQERMSGARPYNIINWDVNPPCRELPPWPDKPPTPPPPPPPDSRQPLNTSKGALSFGHVYGAFGTINVPWLVTSPLSFSHFNLRWGCFHYMVASYLHVRCAHSSLKSPPARMRHS